jgi:hypothetical protein
MIIAARVIGSRLVGSTRGAKTRANPATSVGVNLFDD